MSEIASSPVRVEREGAVTTIFIAHPPVNAINSAVIAGINKALIDAEQDASCHAVIIIGEGDKAFAAGADISEFQAAGDAIVGETQQLTLLLEASRLATIAAVNGIAFGGGCELAMSCDIRLASDKARFGQPEIKLGIIPGWGGTQRLPRLIGRGVAMEMLLLGDPIDAQRAYELGLVNRVVEHGNLMTVAQEMAQKLAQQAPLAVAAIKRAVNNGLNQQLPEALATELDEFTSIFDTDDAGEGINAFMEKRQPAWKGR